MNVFHCSGGDASIFPKTPQSSHESLSDVCKTGETDENIKKLDEDAQNLDDTCNRKRKQWRMRQEKDVEDLGTPVVKQAKLDVKEDNFISKYENEGMYVVICMRTVHLQGI